jgi:hypothetical protein
VINKRGKIIKHRRFTSSPLLPALPLAPPPNHCFLLPQTPKNSKQYFSFFLPFWGGGAGNIAAPIPNTETNNPKLQRGSKEEKMEEEEEEEASNLFPIHPKTKKKQNFHKFAQSLPAMNLIIFSLCSSSSSFFLLLLLTNLSKIK